MDTPARAIGSMTAMAATATSLNMPRQAHPGAAGLPAEPRKKGSLRGLFMRLKQGLATPY